jgi:hypothetical protein
MCDMCEVHPLKWRIDEDDRLLVPLEHPYDKAPTIQGWEPYWVTTSLGSEPEKTVKYRQPVPMFFICAYSETRCYGGPEEGGWGYNERELLATVLWIAGRRELAEASCRRLNQLAHENEVAPGPYMWGTGGIVFSVDRYPGEDDTSMDPRPHYC